MEGQIAVPGAARTALIATSTMIQTDTAVIIAGAGPVGLGLACELGLRGVACLLIEKRDGEKTGSEGE